MNAQEFLTLAGQLVASPNVSEAACRTAISRAYYAAFHSARSYLIDLGYRVSRDHGLPQRYLMAAGDATGLRTGQHLGYLQSERIRADYELELALPLDQQIARHCVEVAHDFLTLLAKCGQEPVKANIKAGIDSYQKKLAPKAGT